MNDRRYVLYPIFALILFSFIVSACNQSGSAETDTILIPAGPFLMGSSLESALHGHSGSLLKDVFKISTNSERQKELKIPVYAQITKGE